MPFKPVFITRKLKVFTDKEVLFPNSAGIAFLVEVIFTMQSNYLYGFLLPKTQTLEKYMLYFPKLLHQFPVFVCKNFSAGDSYIYSDCAFCKNSAQYSKYISTLMKPKKANRTAQESPLSLIQQQDNRNGITRLFSFFICILFALMTF